jgi:putative FmdB family regulatory protein
MPTYDYSCTACEGNFEIFHGMAESGPAVCPGCGAEDSLQKLLSAGSGLIFKGSGFYITDYKKNGSAQPSTEEKASEKKSEASETKETKPSDSKPKESKGSKPAAAA